MNHYKFYDDGVLVADGFFSSLEDAFEVHGIVPEKCTGCDKCQDEIEMVSPVLDIAKTMVAVRREQWKQTF